MRIHPCLVSGLGALALAGCGGGETFLLTTVTHGQVPDNPIRGLRASIDLDDRHDMTPMLAPAAGDAFALPKTLTLEVGSGDGTAVVTIDAFGDGGAPFVSGSTELVFARGDTTEVTVELGRNQRLSPDAPVDLSQLSIAPDGIVDLGTHTAGTTTTRTFRVTNSGTGPSPMLKAKFYDANPPAVFAIANDGCTGAALEPTHDCTFDVRFQPVAAGSWGTNLGVAPADATVATAAAAIVAAADVFSLSPPAVDFGNVSMTATATQSIHVVNSSSTAIANLSWQLAGPDHTLFSIDPSTTCVLDAPLAASSECIVAVKFAPSSTGAKTAALNVTGAQTMSVALSGTGTN